MFYGDNAISLLLLKAFSGLELASADLFIFLTTKEIPPNEYAFLLFLFFDVDLLHRFPHFTLRSIFSHLSLLLLF